MPPTIWETIVSYLNPAWVGVIAAVVLRIAGMVLTYCLRPRMEMSYQYWLTYLIGNDSSTLPAQMRTVMAWQ